MYKLLLTIFTAACLMSAAPQKPTLYLIGDSTVKNGKDKGDGDLWGWGHFIGDSFDTTKISIVNRALGGTSSRTYRTKGLWDGVLAKLQAGDYVILQFGHNDGAPLDDTARARGTIKGIGDEQQEIYNPITKQQEVVHSYGWYLIQIIKEAKAKGATPIVCSPIPRNVWKDGKVARNKEDYGLWAKQVAEREGVAFIDLNALVADVYDQEGETKVASTYFGSKDHTHTIEAGARLNAQEVVIGIKGLRKLRLNKYLK
ncbi:rhamnogalacturonan acetylesterase [Chitinophaga sancti]|uniref:rhamnogalacturonan acetylesterase n=1 Tax=Chitinophaga sancti TaxID=1004 RepID=UPI003F7A28FE